MGVMSLSVVVFFLGLDYNYLFNLIVLVSTQKRVQKKTEINESNEKQLGTQAVVVF